MLPSYRFRPMPNAPERSAGGCCVVGRAPSPGPSRELFMNTGCPCVQGLLGKTPFLTTTILNLQLLAHPSDIAS